MAVAAERGAVEDLATEGVTGASAVIALLEAGVALGQDCLVGLELAFVEIGAVDDGSGTVDRDHLGVVGEADDTLRVLL